MLAGLVFDPAMAPLALLTAPLLASTLLAAPPAAPAAAPAAAAQAAGAAPYDHARFSIMLGGRAGGRFLTRPSATPIAPTSFGGGFGLGLGVRVWQGLYVEANVSEGLYQNPEPIPTLDASSFRHFGPHEPAAAETDPAVADASGASEGKSALLVGQILLGLRYEIRTPATYRLRPSVSLGLTHLHEATVHDFLLSPGKTLMGISKSIRHRTGAQVGAGLRIPFSLEPGRVASRFSARVDADVAYYFDDAPGRLQAGLGLGVQVLF